MNKNIPVKSVVIASLLFGALSGFSQPKPQEQPHRGGAAIAFLEAVNNHEITMAKDVKDKLKRPDVKAFAELMIRDHTENLKQVRMVSKKSNVKPHETEATKKLKEHAHKNEGMTDKAYIDAMVEGHKGALKQIEQFITEVKNPAVKELLEKTKPVVEKHLKKAEAIQRNMLEAVKNMPAKAKAQK